MNWPWNHVVISTYIASTQAISETVSLCPCLTKRTIEVFYKMVKNERWHKNAETKCHTVIEGTFNHWPHMKGCEEVSKWGYNMLSACSIV